MYTVIHGHPDRIWWVLDSFGRTLVDCVFFFDLNQLFCAGSREYIQTHTHTHAHAHMIEQRSRRKMKRRKSSRGRSRKE